MAKGRPDAADLAVADRFVKTILERIETIQEGDSCTPVNVPGRGAPDYGGYYQPLGEEGKPVAILKVNLLRQQIAFIVNVVLLCVLWALSIRMMLAGLPVSVLNAMPALKFVRYTLNA